MSLIDCKVEVAKKPDPKGDRVVLTFEYVTRVFLLTDVTYRRSAENSYHTRHGNLLHDQVLTFV